MSDTTANEPTALPRCECGEETQIDSYLVGGGWALLRCTTGHVTECLLPDLGLGTSDVYSHGHRGAARW